MKEGQVKAAVIVLLVLSLVSVNAADKLEVYKEVFQSQQQIKLSFQLQDQKSDAFVSVVAAYTPADENGERKSLEGQLEGDLTFSPLSTGVYEARLFYGENNLVESHQFLVKECAQGCLSCDSNGECLQAQTGFVLNQQKVIKKCDITCAICQWDPPQACQVCLSGYDLTQDKTCVKQKAPKLYLLTTSSIAAFQEFKFRFENFSGDNGDWVTVAKQGTPDDSQKQYKHFLKGDQNGTIIVDNGENPGVYEIRGYLNFPRGGYQVVARSEEFEIGCAIGCVSCNEKVCLEPEPGVFLNNYGQPEPCFSGCLTCSGPKEDDCLTCLSALKLKNGLCADPTEVPTVKTNKDVFTPFEPIKVAYKSQSASKNDWIAIAKLGDRDSQYLKWQRTEGRSGTITFLEGMPPGQYQVKVHHNWASGGFEVISRYPFEVSCFENCIQCKGEVCIRAQPGFYLDFVNYEIVSCDETCQTCYKGGPSGCTTCPEDRALVGKKVCELKDKSQKSNDVQSFFAEMSQNVQVQAKKESKNKLRAQKTATQAQQIVSRQN